MNFSHYLLHSYVTSRYAQRTIAHKRIHMTHVPDAVASFVPAMQAGQERIMQALHDHQIAIDPYPALHLAAQQIHQRLEYGRGWWNFLCSGEMRRYRKEHQWRRRPPGLILTLRCESVGSKQD